MDAPPRAFAAGSASSSGCDQRYPEFMRHRIRLAWAALGVLLVILGLPSVTEDAAGWASWLSWLENRWQPLLLVLGFLITLVAEGPVVLARVTRLMKSPSARTRPAIAGSAARAPTKSRPRDHRGTDSADRHRTVRGASQVTAAGLRERRIALLVAARVLKARELRAALDNYMETLLLRRAEQDVTSARLTEMREEYGEIQRGLARLFRPLRDLFARFVEEEAQYDLRGEHESPYGGLSPEYPLTKWWRPLTFDQAVDEWRNADDTHIQYYLERQRAVLRAFEEWLEEPENHELSVDPGGPHREDAEVLGLIRRQIELHEAALAARREARMSARQRSISGGANVDQYRFDLLNSGPAAARDVCAWPADENRGVIGAPADVGTLPPNNEPRSLTLEIPCTASRAGGLSLWASWADDTDERREMRLLGIKPL